MSKNSKGKKKREIEKDPRKIYLKSKKVISMEK